MKTRIAILIIAVVVTGLAATAFAKGPIAQQRAEAPRLESLDAGTRAHALLTGSPYLRDLEEINRISAEREQELYAALREAEDLEEVHRLVRRLRRLESETDMEILKVQAHYARVAGMLDLEKEIRARILERMESDTTELTRR